MSEAVRSGTTSSAERVKSGTYMRKVCVFEGCTTIARSVKIGLCAKHSNRAADSSYASNADSLLSYASIRSQDSAEKGFADSGRKLMDRSPVALSVSPSDDNGPLNRSVCDLNDSLLSLELDEKSFKASAPTKEIISTFTSLYPLEKDDTSDVEFMKYPDLWDEMKTMVIPNRWSKAIRKYGSIRMVSFAREHHTKLGDATIGTPCPIEVFFWPESRYVIKIFGKEYKYPAHPNARTPPPLPKGFTKKQLEIFL